MEYYGLEIVGLDLGSGLIMGDFLSEKIPGHEGRGAGKGTTAGVEKNMLNF